jgi:hypothetical protein
MSFDLLIEMEPSRKQRKEGEVFVIQPSKDLFFYGKVIKTQIQLSDPIMNGGHLIYIFNHSSKTLEMPEYLNPNNLLIPPQIINNQGWSKGYFKTLGIQQVTDEERQIDFGFFDIVSKGFVNEEGVRLNCKPKVYGDFGLGSYGTVSFVLKKVLDPTFTG